jgi:poly-gamma-glutamate capsule biosynthesis protein CapA/YwtB (metallophosphatase superfamily)
VPDDRASASVRRRRFEDLVLVVALAAPAVAGAEESITFAGDTFLSASAALPDLGGPVVLNFEGVLGTEGRGAAAIAGRWRLWMRPDAPQILARAGVVAVSVENNHAGDGGAPAAASTQAALIASGVSVIRAGAAWCRGSGDRELCVVAWHDARADLDRALAAVSERAGRGRVVAMVHLSGASPRQDRPLLRRFAAAGAGVVLGVGRHRVGPIEGGPGGWILHGMGDLLFECACSPSIEGLTVEVPHDPAGPLRVRWVGRPADPAAQERRLLELAPGAGAWAVDGALVLD